VYQNQNGWYGELTLAKHTLDFMKIDERYQPGGQTADSRTIGLGYRFSFTANKSRYIGVGLQRYQAESEFRISANTFRIFFEKNNEKRFGIIELAYSQGEDWDQLALKGTHTWFLHSNMGIGINWLFAVGSIDSQNIQYSDEQTATDRFGLLLMFRP